jgi:hypothetical protein
MFISVGESLHLEPDHKDALMQIITLDLVKGDKKDALENIKKLIKLDKGVGNEYVKILERVQ